jgi:hypothetical protein
MNGLIDIRTATLTNALVGLVFWLYMAHVLRTRKTYPGFPQWTIASLCLFAAMVLIGLRDVTPAWASIVGGNTLAVGSIVLVDRGVGLFMGRSPSRAWAVFPVLACVAISIFFTYFRPDVRARIILISLLTMLATVHCIASARAPRARQPGRSTTWLVASLGGLAAWWAARIVLTWIYEGATHDFLSASVVQGVSLVVFCAANIAIFLGLLVLHQQRIESDLTQALEEVRTLQGIIPICSHCKKIRDDRGAWNQLEEYISRHSGAEFSHGYCPECFQRAMTDLK